MSLGQTCILLSKGLVLSFFPVKERDQQKIAQPLGQKSVEPGRVGPHRRKGGMDFFFEPPGRP